eukprot:GFUD01034789.1.p1 GENE.GFUD01034789.1~~GFUD01034789.1.p1  ORF type:complete len:246 (-),score=88.92 GFUD01034789.1:38-775(-)
MSIWSSNPRVNQQIPRCVVPLPPLPQEMELFTSPSDLGNRKEKCFQLVGERLLATLPRDTKVTVKLDMMATNLQTDIKRLYTVVNVLEAIRMMERLGMNTYQWQGWDNMMPSLVWLRQMADKQDMVGLLEIAKKQAELAEIDEKDNTEELDEMKLNCVMMTQKLLMLFLILPEPRIISLSVASCVIFGPLLTKGRRSSCLQKLMDISQVLQSVGLVKRVMVGSKKTLAFQYVWETVKLIQGKLDS